MVRLSQRKWTFFVLHIASRPMSGLSSPTRPEHMCTSSTKTFCTALVAQTHKLFQMDHEVQTPPTPPNPAVTYSSALLDCCTYLQGSRPQVAWKCEFRSWPSQGLILGGTKGYLFISDNDPYSKNQRIDDYVSCSHSEESIHPSLPVGQSVKEPEERMCACL